jgi:hypothetical protein
LREVFVNGLTVFNQKLDQNELTISSWIVRLSSHMGAEKHPTVGSSGEYWSMNESLNQHRAENEISIFVR